LQRVHLVGLMWVIFDLIWGTFSSSRHSYLQCRPVTSGSILSQLFRKGMSIGKGLNPTKRTTNAPVKFFKLRRESLLSDNQSCFCFVFHLGVSRCIVEACCDGTTYPSWTDTVYQFQYPCFKFAIILKFKVMRNRNI
jgi:hypothetical protein